MIILLQPYAFRYDSYLPMSPVTGLHITTNTNTAYNLGTQRGVYSGRRGRGRGRRKAGDIQPRSAFLQQSDLEGSHEEEYDVPKPPLLLSRQGQRAARAAAGVASGGGGEGGAGDEEGVYEHM